MNVMTIAALHEAVKPKLDAPSIQEQLDALRTRLYAALDQIAEAAGAHRCEACDAWALHYVNVFDYSEELGDESYIGCERCSPERGR
jgi:hypothetical protein